ncbi:Rz1-like lysis system protein LysC [Shewanella benthica]|uniref:Rz1-like lysis system protein LysC n=1 Tax=Shewanella benthica TaxID=43661 RepID=UPI003B210283
MLLGCSSKPLIVRAVTTTQTEYVLPPMEMFSECLPPLEQVMTNADHLEYSLLLLSVIAKCNTDWLRLKKWREAHTND